MFETWGRALSRRRRLTLAITFLFVAFAGAWGTGVFGKLSSGDNFTPPASESQREANLADQVFGRNDADVVVLYHSATMTVSDPAYRPAVTTALPGAGPGAGRRGSLTGRLYPQARRTACGYSAYPRRPR
jgi:trehalose monomycolate/heme transporter